MDLLQKLRSRAHGYGITGIDRGTPRFVAGKNLRYFWDEFQEGDYCTIPGSMYEYWNSAKTSAYLYGKRHGGKFRASAGNYLLIWCSQACQTVSRLPEVDADHRAFIQQRLANCQVTIDERGDISTLRGDRLQRAPSHEASRKLLLLYALTGATTPQNYEISED